MSHINRKNGFTLVELMLAMGFVSALLLAIAMTVIQIGNIYTRGITFTNVNQEGGAIANELQRSIASVKLFNLGTNFVNNTESGRLCTGKYSYVWNYGKYLKTPGFNYIKYQGQAVGANPMIFFAKVYDPNFLVCTKTGVPLAYPDIVKNNTTELLNSGQFDLAIHGFKIVSYASDPNTGQQLYGIEFYLGTNNQNAFDIGTTNCSLSGINSNPFYCSVSQFNVLARAGSATNDTSN